jgi:hypothetical protein
MSTVLVDESGTIVAAALVVAPVVDAASGLPRPVLRASTTSPYVSAHVSDGGYLVLSGTPELAVAQLATTPQRLTARLELPDAPALEVEFVLAAATVLPFRPPAVAVELPPAALTGTMHAAKFPYAAIAGAAIDARLVAGPPAFLGLRTPLALAHPVGATVRPRAVTPAAPATALSVPAAGGALSVVVDDVTGCSGANRLLMLGDVTTREHVAIAAVDAGTHRVTLKAPLRRSRGAGATARAHGVGAPGVATTLARAAIAGDGAVALAANVAGAVVEVAGPVTELRATGAVSDADGRWRLDGVRAIGRLNLAASATGFVSETVAHDVDYRHPNVIEFDLTS